MANLEDDMGSRQVPNVEPVIVPRCHAHEEAVCPCVFPHPYFVSRGCAETNDTGGNPMGFLWLRGILGSLGVFKESEYPLFSCLELLPFLLKFCQPLPHFSISFKVLLHVLPRGKGRRKGNEDLGRGEGEGVSNSYTLTGSLKDLKVWQDLEEFALETEELDVLFSGEESVNFLDFPGDEFQILPEFFFPLSSCRLL